MASKLLFVLVALAAMSAKSSSGIVTMDPGDCLQELIRGYNLSADYVRDLLTRMGPDFKLGKDLFVRDYLRLGSPSPSSCLKDQFNEAKKLCNETKAESLVKFCDHFSKQLNNYCQTHSSAVGREYFRSRQQLKENIKNYIAELDEVTRKQYDESTAMKAKSHCEETVNQITHDFEHLKLSQYRLENLVVEGTEEDLDYGDYTLVCKRYLQFLK